MGWVRVSITGNGSSCLHCAAQYGHLGVLRYLLTHTGLNIDLKNSNGISAIDVASKRVNEKKYQEVVNFLRKKGAKTSVNTAPAKLYVDSPESFSHRVGS